VRHTLDGGVENLVVLGSTGEAATILEAERDALITACLEEAGTVPVVAGTGSNATAQAAAWTRRAQALGVQGALVVTPYYNKPTPGGLVAHFQAVTQAAPGLPVIIYNVPGRTGLNLLPATLSLLWQNPQLVAVKESSGNLAQIAEIARTLPQGKVLLSGDDNLALAGRRAEAIAQHQALLPLMDALFLESNPIPTKAALALKGICSDTLRLPLVAASAATRARLAEILKAGVGVA